MNENVRKKSPRAPSIPLSEAIEAAIKIYEKEHRHSAPTEAVAQHLGYKGANNGAALRLIAAVRYYGLLERPADGQLAVAKEVESYQFAPSEEIRRGLLRQWLKTPPIFGELLEKYPNALPSDQTLRYDLIQKGFLPDAVDSVVAALRNSVEFSHFYDSDSKEFGQAPPSTSRPPSETPADVADGRPQVASNMDRIPVRLPGGRRAFLEIPSPFYEADKERIKKQVDLLLTQEDENRDLLA